MSADGVFDLGDAATDVGSDVGVFKGTVAGGVEGTVLEDEVAYVAQGLLAGDVAVDEAHVLRVPGKVFAVDDGVVDNDVLALPEGVLGDDVGMVYLYVLAVLEDVFRVALEVVDIDIVAVHEGVGAVVQTHVPDGEAVDAPEGLVGIIDDDILEGEVLHLAEELRTVDDGVAHRHVIGIPDGRPGTDLEVAVGDDAAVDVPPGIFPDEATAVGLDILTTLDARLSLGDGDILQAGVLQSKEGPFPSE